MRKRIDLLNEVDRQVTENVKTAVTNDLQQLKSLIDDYGETNDSLKDTKKLVEAKSKELKELMAKYGKTEMEGSVYKATISVQHRESLNEDGLLSLFTTVPGFVKYAEKYGIVKTKEYIDMDALESFLYKEELTHEQTSDLDKCRESKDIPTLRMTKIKKGKK